MKHYRVFEFIILQNLNIREVFIDNLATFRKSQMASYLRAVCKKIPSV